LTLCLLASVVRAQNPANFANYAG